jgi:hypothetical protein
VEIRRQRAAFRHLRRRSNKEVFTVAIQARQCADYIPDVGADAEFRHATDIDGYFHEWNLNTENTGNTGNSLDCLAALPFHGQESRPAEHPDENHRL